MLIDVICPSNFYQVRGNVTFSINIVDEVDIMSTLFVSLNIYGVVSLRKWCSELKISGSDNNNNNIFF